MTLIDAATLSGLDVKVPDAFVARSNAVLRELEHMHGVPQVSWRHDALRELMITVWTCTPD